MNKTAAPLEAWKELSSLLASSSLQQANQDYHVATDEVQRLQRQEGPISQKEKREDSVVKESSPPSTLAPVTAASGIERKTEATVQEAALPVLRMSPQQQSPTVAAAGASAVAVAVAPSSDWRFHVQDMTHLSCFQVVLELSDASLLQEDLSVRMDTVGGDRTLVSFRASSVNKNSTTGTSVLRLEFPALLLPGPRVYPVTLQDSRGPSNTTTAAVSVRLSYQGLSTSEHYEQTATPLSPVTANRLACQSCRQSLTQAGGNAPRKNSQDTTTTSNAGDGNNGVIQRVAMLPSGQWDNMADYLQCYPGAPVVDFGSASTAAQQGAVWQDASLAVFHAENVDRAVCVLAVAGYGESGEEERIDEDTGKDPLLMRGGTRPWREAVGGATLTCSQCAVVLGWAPIELSDTFRFLQHRLTVPNQNNSVYSDTQPFGMQRVSSFVAREMIRYADTQAAFTFCVVNVDSRQQRQRLWLRLLTWDSRMAERLAAADSDSFRLQWKSVAKILYEETNEVATDTDDESSSLVWMWNNDWCCPPGKSHDTGTSSSSSSSRTMPTGNQPSPQENGEQSVPSNGPGDFSTAAAATLIRLCLSGEEWEQLRGEFQSVGRYYSSAIVQATILAQTGRMLDSVQAENVGLAAVPVS